MKTENVRLNGLKGTWYVIDEYHDVDGNKYYLWESEQYGDESAAVLTDEHLMVIDYDCHSGILTALHDHGIVEY